MASYNRYSATDVLNAIFNDSESEGEALLSSDESSESEDDDDVEFIPRQEGISNSTSVVQLGGHNQTQQPGQPQIQFVQPIQEHIHNMPSQQPVPQPDSVQQPSQQPTPVQQLAGQTRQQPTVQPQAYHQHQQQPAFQWKMYKYDDPFSNDWLPDFTKRKGVLIDTSNFKEVDFFNLYFPPEAYGLISTETNRYATQVLRNKQHSPHSRFQKWKDSSVAEIKAYVALQIAMGLCQRNEIEDYWRTFWLTHLHFSDVMSRNRYELLTSFLHFSDNEAARPTRGEPGFDNLWKVSPLMDICDPTYQTIYGPHKYLSVDESIIKFKGRVHIRQYPPSKPYRWGIKQYALCESTTGYALKFITYCGKNTIDLVPGYTITESICLSLLEDYHDSGSIVFTDNFYSSPALYKELEQKGIGACGTVKPGRKHMPREIHPKQKHLDKGDDPVFMRSDNMIACTCHDTKRVSFLSTIHTNNTIDKRIRKRDAEGGHREVEKPVIAEAYNQHMGGVDILDKKLGMFAYPHKSSKWYFAVYHRIREVAMVNAYIVYSSVKKDKAEPPRKFRELVINGLLEGYCKENKNPGQPSSDLPARLTERHSIGRFENPKYKPDCIVCSNRGKEGWARKQTNYKCKQCNQAMCFIPCHEIYHTYSDYKSRAAQVVYNLPQ